MIDLDRLVSIRVGDKVVEVIACCLNCGNVDKCTGSHLLDRWRIAECLPEHSLWTQ